MAINEAVPYYQHGATITCAATAAITGKRFVRVTGPAIEDLPAIGPAAAGVDVLGVAAYDAPAGANVSVYRAGAGEILPVTAAGPIPGGTYVASGPDGRAVPAADRATSVGQNIGGDAADGADVKVAMH